jgi:PAS domain S-box-containing protein
MASDKAAPERTKDLKAKIKQLERELHSYRDNENESRLRRAEIASGSGNWEIHLDTAKMYGSEGAIRLYGLRKAEMSYEDVKGIPLPEYRTRLDNALKELVSLNKPYDIEFKIRNAETGKIIDLHSTAEYDSKNRKVFGIIKDITHQKASEEQIRRKSQHLATLLEITMELLEKADRRNVLKNILEGAKRLVGLESGAIYSVADKTLLLESTIPPLTDDFPDEFRKAHLINHPLIAKALEMGTPVIIPDITAVSLTPQESVIVSQRDMRTLMFIPLIASGQSYGIIVLGTLGRTHNFEENEISLCRTISNIASLALENSILIANLKSARDKAEESDKLKTAFLHNISHEIRTPLNAIIGFTGLLDQPDLDDSDRKKFIEIIHHSNNQLLSIINDIFNVSHIEAGQVFLKEDITDIRLVLNNLYIQFLPEITGKGLDFKLDLNNFTEDGNKIITDEGKLIQILSNLISNAIKFTSIGQIILGCSKENHTLKFYVEDTGIGIPESENIKVFERFYQVDKSVSRVYSGAGLGLSISDAYVRLLGGSIKLDSVPGKGSHFSFEIPNKTPFSYESPVSLNLPNG